MNNADFLLFNLAIAFGVLSTAGYLLSLFLKRVALARISTWILLASFALMTVTLLLSVSKEAGLINPGRRDFFLFCAWSVAGIYLALQLKTKTRVLGAFVTPLILLLQIAAAAQQTGTVLVPADMQNSLTLVHLILAVAGEALFALASLAGLIYLIQNSNLKRAKFDSLIRLLPSLNDLERINRICLLWGFSFLTAGLISGVAFAGAAWQAGWYADPKIIWTFGVWVVYGFLLHQRLAIGWRGARMARLSVAAFVVFVITYWLIKICFATIHDFI
ncbi:MAG TPA: cytochrome c biogenesis protein CcsA [Smithellaceae bacterium]|nr:cytochrome c biogenesis protein CcsA [Smithellaceae bacterium]